MPFGFLLFVKLNRQYWFCVSFEIKEKNELSTFETHRKSLLMYVTLQCVVVIILFCVYLHNLCCEEMYEFTHSPFGDCRCCEDIK